MCVNASGGCECMFESIWESERGVHDPGCARARVCVCVCVSGAEGRKRTRDLESPKSPR